MEVNRITIRVEENLDENLFSSIFSSTLIVTRFLLITYLFFRDLLTNGAHFGPLESKKFMRNIIVLCTLCV